MKKEKKPTRLGLYGKDYQDGGLLFHHSKALFQPNMRDLYDQCFDFDFVFAAFMLPRLRYFRHHRTLLGTDYLTEEEHNLLSDDNVPTETRDEIQNKANDTYNAALDEIVESFEAYINWRGFPKKWQTYEEYWEEEKAILERYRQARLECMKLMDGFWL
jgi:hypothetical protein